MTSANRVLTFAVGVLIVASAGSASAASFTAYTQPYSGGNNCSGVQGAQNSATPLAAFASCGVPGITTLGEAHSGYGTVGASTSALGGGNSTAVASFFDTVQFTRGDHSEGLTLVSMVFDLSGFLTADSGPFDPFVPNAEATASIFAQVFFAERGPFVFSQDIRSDRFGAHVTTRDDFTVIGNTSVGSGISLLLRTIDIQVPLNRNISFGFNIVSGASAFGPAADADSDFSHTLGFVPGGRPFVLQDGVTANAGTYLVNNRFGAAPGGVPEPASWTLMIAGFGLTGAALRRRRTAIAA